MGSIHSSYQNASQQCIATSAKPRRNMIVSTANTNIDPQQRAPTRQCSLLLFVCGELSRCPLPLRRQELPRIARERPADWARLVAGLDPVTAYVITTQWESAGGAAGMPEFYAAIFGTGEEHAVGPPLAATKKGAGVVDATGSDVGVAGGGGGGSDGGVAGVSFSADPAATLEECAASSGFDDRPEAVQGVALQERLVRLRETFAKEQCAAVLRQATGW